MSHHNNSNIFSLILFYFFSFLFFAAFIFFFILLFCIRVGGGPGTFFSTHGNHLPWLSGVHGLKDFLWSDHLHESFDGRIYTYWSVLKSKFVHQRTQEDEHYRENPSNHELLTVRGVDRRAFLKMFQAQITV